MDDTPRESRAASPFSCDISEIPRSRTLVVGRKEAALIRDVWGSPLTLADALGRDDDFWARSRQLRNSDEVSPEELARAYARGHNVGRRAIAELLDIASGAADRKLAHAQLVIRVGLVATFTEAALEPGDSRRARRVQALERDRRGVDALIRRAANRCLRCNAALQEPRAKSSKGWLVFRDYCSPCERHLVPPQKRTEVEADQRAVKAVLDAAGASILGEPSRVRAARVRRATRE